MFLYIQTSALIILYLATTNLGANEFCSKDDTSCASKYNLGTVPRYLFYNVNYPEGFNLRRDVYMRLAVFMHMLQKEGQDWHLVLPPWPHLYHWQSTDIDNQNDIPWKLFFDLNSLKRFSPVLDYKEFLKEAADHHVDEVYVLQHFDGAFTNKTWNWDDRWSLVECDKKILCLEGDCGRSHYSLEGGLYHGWYWSYKDLDSKTLHCVSFQGPASFLRNVLKQNSNSERVLIDRAEIVVHDRFGDKLYWRCRRSMRFSEILINQANKFRIKFLASNDTADKTLRPLRWEDEKENRNAIGGPYLCAHLRRGDFAYGRRTEIPSVEFSAKQIRDLLHSLKLGTVFLATDAVDDDIRMLKKHLEDMKVIQYAPDKKTKQKIKDGGVAIVDQIICSYARFFIGTHESTFSFRIQEEREIIGFPTKSTFNAFCASPNKCFEPTKWKIVY